MLSADEARAKLGVVDWPAAVDCSIDTLVAERVWVPYSRATGRIEFAHPNSRITQLMRPPGLSPSQLANQRREGERVVGAASDDAVLVPFWVFSPSGGWDGNIPVGPADQQPWVAIDATLGLLAAGHLPANVGAARVRLFYLLGVLLLALSLGVSVSVFALGQPLRFVRMALENSMLALLVFALLATALVVGYLGYRLRHLVPGVLDVLLDRGLGLPAALVEPIARVQQGRVRYPLDRRWLGLVRWSGGLILVCCFGQLAIVAGQAGFVGSLATTLGAFALVLGLTAGGLAVSSARGNWLPMSARERESDVDRDDALSELVRTVLRVSVLCCVGFVLGAAFSMSGLGEFLFGARVTKDNHLMMEWGARIGACIGAALAPASIGVRVTMTLSIAIEILAFQFLGPLLAPVVVFALLLLAALPAVREAEVEHAGRASLFVAWNFSLGATLGRLCGGALGALMMGPVGFVLGDALGDHAGSAIGVRHATNRIRDKTR